MRTWSFAKGHGTLNDFVLIKDRSGMLNPSAEDVAFLCDRRRGIGADGFLRAVSSDKMTEWNGPGGLWFMDYRNADGSYAQMCGNGLRVFVQWLFEEGLAAGTSVDIATRAGLRRAYLRRDGRISVGMGVPTWNPVMTWVEQGGHRWDAHGVDVGNPHCVVRLDRVAQLEAIDLSAPFTADPAMFPQGANVEFVVPLDHGLLQMRVYERGVGETMSCGTGVVAVSCDDRGLHGEQCDVYHVQIPGGVLKVEFDDGQAVLTGPATIVARGEVILPDA